MPGAPVAYAPKAAQKERTKPSILITGTPGTGKTTTAQLLAEQSGLAHVNVGALVKEKGLHDGYDAEFDTYLLDEDKVCDELEDLVAAGGAVVDHHGCDFFPERWFDLVIVLRSESHVLYDRLQARGYQPNKLQENMECEIMQVVLEEARESYASEIVIELASNTLEDLDSNVDRIQRWVDSWMSDRSSP